MNGQEMIKHLFAIDILTTLSEQATNNKRGYVMTFELYNECDCLIARYNTLEELEDDAILEVGDYIKVK